HRAVTTCPPAAETLLSPGDTSGARPCPPPPGLHPKPSTQGVTLSELTQALLNGRRDGPAGARRRRMRQRRQQRQRQHRRGIGLVSLRRDRRRRIERPGG